ncbi:hypothetical protein BDZ45DRAFT_749973 [Acephala macrosclerotiorum]|nr:hypothetical protein BDZ45DRAFT_749973 [Acephala macrosclerotiorum]
MDSIDTMNTTATMQTTIPTVDAGKAIGVDNPASVTVDSSASDSSHVSDTEQESDIAESEETNAEELRCCRCKEDRSFDPDDDFCEGCDHIKCQNCGVRDYMDCCLCLELVKRKGTYCHTHDHQSCGNCARWGADVEGAFCIDSDVENSDDEYEWEANSKPYHIENFEANKVADLALVNLLEPINLDKYLAAKTFLPTEIYLSTMTAALTVNEPRVIRAIWDHQAQQWTYRCFSPPNTIPASAWVDKGALQSLVPYTLQDAPTLNNLSPYGHFNYNIDELFLDYQRCGNRSYDQKEYKKAMYAAINALVAHYNHPGTGKLKFLRISWCQQEESPGGFLWGLKGVRSLERVILDSHDHYEDPETCEEVGGNARGRKARDEQAMDYVVEDGDLERCGLYVILYGPHGGVVGTANDPEEDDNEDEGEEDESGDEDEDEESGDEDEGSEVDDEFWVSDAEDEDEDDDE